MRRDKICTYVFICERGLIFRLADPARVPVEKTRWKIPYRGHTVEVDIYPFWQDRAIAEAEPCPLPPYLTLVREVSDDKRYKNAQPAREVPNDPL